jgi:hypothetical protein
MRIFIVHTGLETRDLDELTFFSNPLEVIELFHDHPEMTAKRLRGLLEELYEEGDQGVINIGDEIIYCKDV